MSGMSGLACLVKLPAAGRSHEMGRRLFGHSGGMRNIAEGSFTCRPIARYTHCAASRLETLAAAKGAPSQGRGNQICHGRDELVA